MASPASGLPVFMDGLPPLNPQTTTNPKPHNSQPLNYTNILKPNALKAAMHATSSTNSIAPIPLNLVTFLHGQPFIKWTEAEVSRINVIEGIQYAIVWKFSYGWIELQEIRKILPAQCGVKC